MTRQGAVLRSVFGSVAGLVAVGLLAGCGGEGAAAARGVAAGPLTVYTTFYPTTWFAERIGGPHVRVVCPIPDDADPIFWMPDAATLQAYQQADLVVINGAQFEKWVEKVSLPPSRLVNSAGGFSDRWLHYEHAVAHSHGPVGDHAHTGIDGHTWLDVANAADQARAIAAALRERLPHAEAAIDANLMALLRDLAALDTSLRSLSVRIGTTPLLASHPAYNYIARRYGWNVRNLNLDPATLPDEAALAAIRAVQAEHPASLILWESEPDAAIAGRLQETLGLRSIVFAPCELLDASARAAGENYLVVMRRNIAALAEALSPAAVMIPASEVVLVP